MSSVGKKLTLNFSRARLKKKDHLQDESDMGHRRGSWDTLHPRGGGARGDKSSSLTHLGVSNGEVLNHSDIMDLTQIVRSFTEALYSLKSLFNLEEKQDFTSPTEVKTEAHERLGRLLCQLSGMKKYPTVLTSDVLMAVHHVITRVKLCNYEDFTSESAEVLDFIDKLALSFSTSVSEYLMGGMNLDSSIARSKSCEHLADHDQNSSIHSSERHSISTVLTEPNGDIDLLLLKFDHAVDMALNRAKLWSKYAKDITYYVEKRASMEAEFAKNLAKLAAGVQQTISEDTFLPFQSIFCTALEQDTDYTNKCHATYSMIQTTKFVGPVHDRRIEHDKTRKALKDMWTKETKKMHDAVGAVKKARALYVSRWQEYEKAKDASVRAENESTLQTSGMAKMEKKKRMEEDCLHKAMEAEATYKSCIGHANNCQQELENVKADILLQTRDLLLKSDQVLKSATVGYFQLLQNAIAPVPSQYMQLFETSENYDPGCKYAEYVRHLPAPNTPYSMPHYSFEPYSPDSRGYELRKPSTQSSGSGSDVQMYGEDTPPRHRMKTGTTDADSDSDSESGSSPGNSPRPSHRRHKHHGGQRRMTTFGVDLSAHVARSHAPVPPLLAQCTAAIDERALDIKGIYRVSGVKSRVESLCQSFETQQHVDLTEQNPHVISNVLKLYLRQLPEPLLSFKLYPVLVQLAKDESSGSVAKEDMVPRLKEAMQTLPPAFLRTLAHLMHHLARVVHNEPSNQMSAANLGIVFGPNLLRTNDGGSSLNSLIETPHQTRIIELLIVNADSIFGSEEKAGGTAQASALLSPDTGTPEVTTPLSATWATAPAEITGNLMAELEKDPQFMQASSTATAFPATAGEVNANNQATNPNQSTTHTDQPAAEQPCDQPVLRTKESHLETTDSADGPRTSSQSLHAHPSNQISDAPNTISSSPNTNKNSVSETPGDSIGIKKKPNVVDGKSNDEIENAETQPKTNPADMTGAKTENTKPAINEPEDLQRTSNLTVAEDDKKANGGSSHIKTEDTDSLADDQKSAAACSSLLKTALISPPRELEANPNVAELTRSPGLKKRLLGAQVRSSKIDSKASSLAPHLSQPRPFSFRASKTPKLLLTAPSCESQDDINIPSSSLFAKSLKRDDADPLSKSASSASNSSVLKQLRSINQVKRQLPLTPGSPPYVSPYASPVVSPMTSPKVSPNGSPSDTPKQSPRNSPRVGRRIHSPLTLVTDREPQYV